MSNGPHDPNLVDRLRRKVSEGARDHSWLLRREYEKARERYGSLPLSFDAYAAGVIQRAEARLDKSRLEASDSLEELLQRTALPDLFLAVACETDVPGAWETLSRMFLPRLEPVILRRGATPADAEEIVANLPGDLARPVDGGAPYIARYDGSGSLFRWLATVVLRRHADRLRRNRIKSLDTGADAPDPRSNDPAEHVLDGEAAECLKQALEAAFEKLTRREFLSVHFKYRAGLPQRRIASLVDTDEPGLSRILGRAVQKIRDAVNRRVEVDGHPAEGGHRWQALKETLEIQLQDSAPDPDSLSGEEMRNG
jgi:RNA polymerase sigma-70 factor